ncbi:MAG: lysylphosphatidylglycerol synthase transmembrane domain-containing protein [Bryobacteraceae bacterium]
MIAAPPETSTKRHGLKIAVTAGSIALAAVLLYYSLRGIEWRRVGLILGTAHLSWLGAICLLASTALFLRAYRWRILLRAAGDVRISTAFWATAAGYFGNNFLPARAGEVVRTMMIGARAGLGKAFVLTTALSERMADAIALVTISALVLLTLPSQPGWLASAAKPFAIAGIGAVVAIAVLPWLEPLALRLLSRVALPDGLNKKLAHLIGQIVHGIRSFHDPGRMAGFLGLTIVIWCIDATGAIFVGRAMGLALNIPIAFLLITGLGLGSALPSTPGYVGIYQFVAVSVLTPFGIARTDAIAYILLLQASTYVVITFWGLVGLWRLRQSGGHLANAVANPDLLLTQ